MWEADCAEARGRGGGQGFNVLKQLLLAENGIKALSQRRQLHNGDEIGLLPGLTDRAEKMATVETGTETEGRLLHRHHHHRHHHNHHQQRHHHSHNNMSLTAKGLTNDPSPIPRSQSPPAGHDRPKPKLELPSEPPWLTKTNPILYYMLQ